MKQLYINQIAQAIGEKAWKVENCVDMLEQGDTIPFISRYRKEKTGGLDDVVIDEIQRLKGIYDTLEKRKETVLKTIDGQGALTEELHKAIDNCVDANVLEDIYLPFKPKRRTRAQVAREAGLGPFADDMMQALVKDPLKEAKRYICEKAPTEEDVLAGARDILAEQFSEISALRADVRHYMQGCYIISKATKAADGNPDALNYKAYFNSGIPLRIAPANRILAMLRGQEEGFLTVKIQVASHKLRERLYFKFYRDLRKPSQLLSEQIRQALQDSLDRLIVPSVSNEIIGEEKAKADIVSIRIFGENLRQLLLAAPIGQKRIMAVDPGFRNGCKIVCLDAQGNLLHHEIIYPHPPKNEKVKSIVAVSKMMNDFDIQAIAIGNGTAGRETEDFFKRIPMPDGCKVYSVSEDGASVYSASDIAREEFPDEDVTVRGSVSIGRRLMDPLAELVKIDPKSLGVGQYQHDVDQTLLKRELDNVVEQCVSKVGVNVNTSSPYLLRYVAGIGPALSSAIVDWRNANGPFGSRSELLKVPRLGPKVFKQCAGFIRVEGPNPLDNSAIHPETYPIVDRMASVAGVTVSELVRNEEKITALRERAGEFASEDFGLPTITDILDELSKPGRDPRKTADTFSFDENVHEIEDLQEGMALPGMVTNVTEFGAFVDIGVHKEGLVHTSRMNGHKPKIGEPLIVRVASVDLERNRIGLAIVSKYER